MRFAKAFVALALFAAAIIVDPSNVVGRQQGPEQPDMTIDAATRKEVIDTLLKRLNESYVFPETAAKMEQAVRARLANKEYDGITSAKAFAMKLTEDVQAVSKDKHLRVRYSHRPLPERGQRREPSPEE